MAFKILRRNCCGLDVHKTWIFACIGITDANGRTEYKLDDVFSNVFGESSRSIVQHILEHPGEQFDVAPFLDRRCKHSVEDVQAALLTERYPVSRLQNSENACCISISSMDTVKRLRLKFCALRSRILISWSCSARFRVFPQRR